ncbi:hypothetical protein R3P38DRAFT_3350736 [Favolaschia claudopus]|uniref:Uncharacterized protein n=1 Tax=Favolaschia claudopus TaxID=2862362 RepID=A0AAW0C9C9_9AGAR
MQWRRKPTGAALQAARRTRGRVDAPCFHAHFVDGAAQNHEIEPSMIYMPPTTLASPSLKPPAASLLPAFAVAVAFEGSSIHQTSTNGYVAMRRRIGQYSPIHLTRSPSISREKIGRRKGAAESRGRVDDTLRASKEQKLIARVLALSVAVGTCISRLDDEAPQTIRVARNPQPSVALLAARGNRVRTTRAGSAMAHSMASWRERGGERRDRAVLKSDRVDGGRGLDEPHATWTGKQKRSELDGRPGAQRYAQFVPAWRGKLAGLDAAPPLQLEWWFKLLGLSRTHCSVAVTCRQKIVKYAPDVEVIQRRPAQTHCKNIE